MAEQKTESIQSTVRKLNSKRFQFTTASQVVLLQLELIVRTYMRGVRPRKIVVSKLDVNSDEVIEQKEFELIQSIEVESYLHELGANDEQTKRYMTWITNKAR